MSNIQITPQETSNPKILKFEASSFLVQYNSFEYANIDEAKNSPLAQQLFYLPFVKKVYISGNFVAIERYDIVSWSDVQNEVSEQIQEYLNSGGLVVIEEKTKKNPISIYAESTPNPSVLKFVANKNLVTSTFEFASIEEAKPSPFATALFQFPFIKSVFLDKNYVSITKFDIVEWEEITLELRTFIKTYIEDGKEMVSSTAAVELEKTTEQLDRAYDKLDDTSKEIINILEQHVKPAVASDGGNIMFESYNKENKVVKVILQGACSGCPSSTFTLKNGIETILKEMMGPKIERVEAVNG
ncbi:MAG: NifU family protein [Bacteroidetes bacterium]|nr:NifU family protein [Bacteroidota bacterium]MDA0861028.1 NifU family protein [Bacteroidota bacterium]MDA1319300.1 NifU family protein [Bacteroidota bacterium]